MCNALIYKYSIWTAGGRCDMRSSQIITHDIECFMWTPMGRIMCNNYPVGPHVATAIWPCIYLHLFVLVHFAL